VRRSDWKITGDIVSEFAGSAVVWLIPALLLLPIYLLLVAISVLASEGALLEFTLGARGRIHSALGLLMVLSAVAVAVLLPMYALTSDDWINGVFMVAVAGGAGVYLVYRELRKIAIKRQG
jgi:hypothetical protein